MKNCLMNYFYQQEKIKIRNAFADNMSTDIKLSKVQLSKIILGALLGKFSGSLMKVDVPWVKNALTPWATMAWASVTDGVFLRKMRGRGFVRAGKRISLVISNVNMDDIIKIIKLPEN